MRPAFQGMPWKAGRRAEDRCCSRWREGGRGDQTRGNCHDPGIASSGCLCVRDSAPARNGQEDGPQAHRLGGWLCPATRHGRCVERAITTFEPYLRERLGAYILSRGSGRANPSRRSDKIEAPRVQQTPAEIPQNPRGAVQTPGASSQIVSCASFLQRDRSSVLLCRHTRRR